MAEKLTPQQQMAVSDRGGRLLVSAAAGSGKTKVLVDRLLSYILDPNDPANIDEFLIITYTKAAASELRGKIAAKLSERIAEDPANRHLQRQLQRLYLTKISTVHSFCSDILREYAYKLDISGDFHVGDEDESAPLRQRALEQVLEQAYETAEENPDFMAFVDSQGLGRSDALVPKILEKVYDNSRCHLDPDGWLQSCISAAEAEDVDDAARTVWGKFLMDDLMQWLDGHIAAMEECFRQVSAMDGQAKSAALFADLVGQLKHLRQSTTWDEVVERKHIEYGRLEFSRKTNDPAVSEPVKTVRKACKDILDKKLLSFSDPSRVVLEDLAASAAAARGLVGMVRQFRDAYERIKRSHHLLDFGDLEHKTLDLLLGKSRSGPTLAASEIAKRFREIMVDEYQDSNAAQDAIFDVLSGKRHNLFMVGDVKQSIYSFRLANPGIFLEKYAGFVPAESALPGQGRKVMLSSNFRSGGGVIKGVNDVFYQCMSRSVGGLDYTREEALREGIPHIDLPEPEVELHGIEVMSDTYAEEAAFVARRIRQLTDGTHYVRNGESLRPIAPEDIVILLRSPNSVGQEYVDALASFGIRCVTGGGNNLLLTEEIIALRSFLQILSNPRQDIPLIATLASPIFGFSANDLAVLRAGRRNGYVYDAVCQWNHEKGNAFLAAFRKLREEARLLPLPELLQSIFSLTDMEAVYAAMPGGEMRVRNLRDFYSLAVKFVSTGPKDLEQFLSHIDALEGKKLALTQGQSASGCVTLMSVHKSKGLEFPVVFLCGLSRRFNRDSLKAQVLCDQDLGLGLSCVEQESRIRYPAISKRAIAAKITADSLSEEMRVLYVALTRARDRLIMTYSSASLRSELLSLVHRMQICPREMITGHVPCPGHWVLLTALTRTEAGELFAVSSNPHNTQPGTPPWLIRVSESAAVSSGSKSEQEQLPAELPAGALESLKAGLAFSYPHKAATEAPSKQTATQRKGRQKDQEAAEFAGEPKHILRTWRKPSFVEEPVVKGGTEYGSAIHAALQYIRYEACCDEASVRGEIRRLADERFLTPKQAEMVDCESLSAFFESPFGQRLRSAENVLREFKFSILDDGADYDSQLAGEYVLLQGVVDCAIVEEDGIVLLDFKTDRVTSGTVSAAAERYAPQIRVYADALHRIFGKPIKEKYLYFFRLNRFIPL